MIYPILTPEEAAEYIQNGMNIGEDVYTIERVKERLLEILNA